MNRYQQAAASGLAIALAALPACALAIDFSLGSDIEGRLNGTATFGTMIRTESADPRAYPYIASRVVSNVQPGQLYGLTASPDLNYERGKAVSTVLKGLLELDLHKGDLGVFTRAYAWQDYTLGQQGVPYGNYPNGYNRGGALSDAGFPAEARFSGAQLRDIYVYDRFSLGRESALNLKLGRQVLNWGTSQFFAGGINAAINPTDYAAQVRPGALPEESRLPVGMLSASLASGKQWGVDGFVEYEFRPSVMPGCGTFFDFSSVTAGGCNMAGLLAKTVPAALRGIPALAPLTTVYGISEPGVYQNGYYLRRSPDVEARNGGQMGLSVSFKSAAGTEYRAYAMRTHSTAPTLRVNLGNSANATSVLNGTDLALFGAQAAALAQQLNRMGSPVYGATYSTAHAEGINLFGASFDKRMPDIGMRVFGEIAFRPNQPISWNGNDLTTGALTRSSTAASGVPEPVMSRVLGTPVGGSFDAFDRFNVTTASVGINQVVPQLLGASRFTFAGELGYSRVSGLPDPDYMRYGRSFVYGAAPVRLANGSYSACSETSTTSEVPNGVPGKTCTTSGFVTTNAWGVRARIAAAYPAPLLGATLTPSLLLTADVQGYSYDGTFSAGRRTIAPGLRADWSQGFFAEIRYTKYYGGDYNLLIDKSNLTLVAGAKF